jgi:prepilin-type N-terminal cleavage/methylation domain-containing protein
VKALFKALGRNSPGFTLVELIICVAIIGMLASAVIINVAGPAEASQSSSGAETDPLDSLAEPTDIEGLQAEVEIMAEQMEFQIVQTALDTMMIRNQLTRVQKTQFTGDMAAFPADNPLYPRYLRKQNTKCLYSCDSTGMVTQQK